MPTILSSRQLTLAQAELLLNAGIAYTDYNAIRISLTDFTCQQPIENAIITSQNTVKALLSKNCKIENCFCVGEKTKRLLEDNGYRVIEMFPYGKELGQCLVKHYSTLKFTFFCGSRRRPEMPAILQKAQIDFEEIQVYQTQLNPQKFDSHFDGILFFSPSQVESYIQHNQMADQTAFCIGTSTAQAAKPYTHNIIIAHKPTVENVLVQVIKKFKP